ncbi:MAG TPA: hypothetical protein VIZ65_06140 [Cellvibrionaceae bacterium]
MSFPAPSEQADFSLLTSPEGEFWVAYELPRDFLSTPRHYAVLAGHLGSEGQMAWLQPMQQPAEEFVVLEDGFYFLSLSNSLQELRVCACELKLLDVIVHSQGPLSALLHCLGRSVAS